MLAERGERRVNTSSLISTIGMASDLLPNSIITSNIPTNIQENVKLELDPVATPYNCRKSLALLLLHTSLMRRKR